MDADCCLWIEACSKACSQKVWKWRSISFHTPIHTRSIPESCHVRIILLRPLIFDIQFLSTLISLNTFDLLQPCHASEVYGGLYQDRLFQHILCWSIDIIDLESPYEEVWIKSLGDNSSFHTCGSPRTDPYPFLEPYPYENNCFSSFQWLG